MKMNEQVSRLYHLAWNYSEFDDEYKENPTYERRCVVQSKIFAELIVREICDMVEEDGSAVLPLVIKRHFGVE